MVEGKVAHQSGIGMRLWAARLTPIEHMPAPLGSFATLTGRPRRRGKGGVSLIFTISAQLNGHLGFTISWGSRTRTRAKTPGTVHPHSERYRTDEDDPDQTKEERMAVDALDACGACVFSHVFVAGVVAVVPTATAIVADPPLATALAITDAIALAALVDIGSRYDCQGQR